MKKILCILLAFGCYSPVFVSAQSDIDALRYSQSSLTGTARFVSMGGAFGALGADFSSLSYNPAGIGLYRKSEFTFTPSVYFEKTTSNFLSTQGVDNKSNFNFGNFGMVFAKRLSRNDSTPGWKSINFGIGYNRLNNFHSRSAYQGINPNNSYLDYILQNVNSGGGVAPENMNPFDESLAYNTFLINPDTIDAYNSVIPNGGELQRRTSETRGSSGEMVMSIGSDYSHRLYLGATLGIAFLRYEENTSYQEIDQYNKIHDFDNFNFLQNLTTTGVGVNFKFGAIFRATEGLRLGAAFHIPTYYSMHDNYFNTMQALTDSGYHVSDSPYGSFDYNFNTPFKFIGSIAYIFGKAGLISADYEFVDYSEMHFRSYYSSDFYDVNNTIQNKYASTGNLKIGTEWRLADVYALRAGYAFFGSPFASGVAVKGYDQEKTSYTVGFGIREKNYFVDLGYAYSISHDYYQSYSLDNPYGDPALDAPGALNKVVTSNFLLTFGWRF